jgi:hypothetical protein
VHTQSRRATGTRTRARAARDIGKVHRPGGRGCACASRGGRRTRTRADRVNDSETRTAKKPNGIRRRGRVRPETQVRARTSGARGRAGAPERCRACGNTVRRPPPYVTSRTGCASKTQSDGNVRASHPVPRRSTVTHMCARGPVGRAGRLSAPPRSDRVGLVPLAFFFSKHSAPPLRSTVAVSRLFRSISPRVILSLVRCALSLEPLHVLLIIFLVFFSFRFHPSDRRGI